MPLRPQPLARLPLPQTVFLVLATLADGPAHGYRLRAELAARSRGLVRLDPGSLYRLVGRLLDEGLIDDVAGAGDVEPGRRRTYRLTSEGRRILIAETRRLADLVAAVQSAVGRGRRVRA
jgi:DNA-binding PadR family transcriptional regulator